jgi:ABC-2 type transport system ATP-binding protein
MTMTTLLLPAIQTSELTKRFGRIVAVRRLNLSVPLGSISGFLGQNGAGKSTTLKMLMGAVRPSHGSGQILGLSIEDPVQSVEIRKRVAFVGEDKGLYDYMTVEQIIGFTKSFFSTWRSDLEHKFLRHFPLPFDRKIKKLSKGMRTQLALLLGIARGPEMLVLDEPSEGLDPVAIEILLQLLKNLAAEGVSIFFSSHQLADVEQIADHVFIIDRGELLVGSSVDRLKNEFRRIAVAFENAVQEKELIVGGVKDIQAEGKMLSLFVSHNLDHILERIRALQPTKVEVMPVSLKEIFLQSLKAR